MGNSAYTYLSYLVQVVMMMMIMEKGRAWQGSAGHKRKESSVFIRLHTVHSNK